MKNVMGPKPKKARNHQQAAKGGFAGDFAIHSAGNLLV